MNNTRPITPPNKPFNPFSSPRSPHLIPLSHPPSPIPRDDIIEGMSASNGSIFERDVEHFDTSLTAQEAIQLAVPPVLDEAIEALATVSPENILVDQMPLEYHLFNSSLSPNSIELIKPSSATNPSLPASSSSLSLSSLSSSPLNPLSIPSSTPTAHHQSQSLLPTYPFPLLNSPTQLNPSPQSSHPPPSPPSILPRLHHQTLSCTSDTASISDPSSPRSLSPTPSYKIGRSMVTQLTADLDSFATPSNTNHPPIPPEIISTNALLKNQQQPPQPILPALSSNHPAQHVILPNNYHNHPEEQGIRKLRQRKTCISFMSYVDVLNSERADPSSDSAVPSTSAMNALRMARKSTSSLVKRASSIFSHSPRIRSSKNNNIMSTSPNENLGKAWVDRSRSRCTSSNTFYQSYSNQQPPPGESQQHQHLLPLKTEEAEAEVLGELA